MGEGGTMMYFLYVGIDPGYDIDSKPMLEYLRKGKKVILARNSYDRCRHPEIWQELSNVELLVLQKTSVIFYCKKGPAMTWEKVALKDLHPEMMDL
jgi:hypothetical protein